MLGLYWVCLDCSLKATQLARPARREAEIDAIFNKQVCKYTVAYA